jgi:A/G-specific adenine glycosylase
VLVCRAEKDGVVSLYPVKGEKAKKREERVVVTIVRAVDEKTQPQDDPDTESKDWKSGKFLLLKRPENGLLAGLWEFPLKATERPSSQEHPKESTKDEQAVMDGYLRDEVGVNVVETLYRKSLGERVHVFSHIRMTMVIEELCCVVESTKDHPDGGLQWLTYDAIAEKGLSSSVKKCLKAFSDHHADRAKKAKHGIAKFFAAKN